MSYWTGSTRIDLITNKPAKQDQSNLEHVYEPINLGSSGVEDYNMMNDQRPGVPDGYEFRVRGLFIAVDQPQPLFIAHTLGGESEEGLWIGIDLERLVCFPAMDGSFRMRGSGAHIVTEAGNLEDPQVQPGDYVFAPSESFADEFSLTERNLIKLALTQDVVWHQNSDGTLAVDSYGSAIEHTPSQASQNRESDAMRIIRERFDLR